MTAINLAIVTLADGAGLAPIMIELQRRSAASGAETILLSPTLRPHIFGGDLLWRLSFPDRSAYETAHALLALDGLAGVAHVDWAAFEPVGQGRRAPSPPGSVYRQMTMHVPAETPRDIVHRFEQETLGLADNVTQILRWTLGRVFAAGGDRPWSHVWEQEFAAVDDFRGPYMNHPWHWGLVDRWFDPEMPERIVDRRLCNSLCPLSGDAA